MHFFKKFLQCFFVWRLNLPEWSGRAQALCACAFGRGDESCNEAMGSHISTRARRYYLPYCVQAEVGEFVDPELLDGFVSEESLDRHGRGYVGTHETVEQQVLEYLRPHGITKIHLEAHPEHAWRVVMCYRHFGMDVVSLCVKGKPYPAKSTQMWCRSKPRFVLYEILARLISLKKGYI